VKYVNTYITDVEELNLAVEKKKSKGLGDKWDKSRIFKHGGKNLQEFSFLRN
jgi:hypothetical protein